MARTPPTVARRAKVGLILDFGEVLVRSQPAAVLAEMAGLAGLDVDEFRRLYWQHRPFYDSGGPAVEYWKRVLGWNPERGTGNLEPEPGTIAALVDADARSWTDYREEMWTLTSEFRANGGRTALLSNGVPEVMALVRAQRRLADYFDVEIVSYEVGCIKPDERIYMLCLSELGVPPGSALFVDDRAENIEAARRLGIDALLFRGDESMPELRERLAVTR